MRASRFPHGESRRDAGRQSSAAPGAARSARDGIARCRAAGRIYDCAPGDAVSDLPPAGGEVARLCTSVARRRHDPSSSHRAATARRAAPPAAVRGVHAAGCERYSARRRGQDCRAPARRARWRSEARRSGERLVDLQHSGRRSAIRRGRRRPRRAWACAGTRSGERAGRPGRAAIASGARRRDRRRARPARGEHATPWPARQSRRACSQHGSARPSLAGGEASVTTRTCLRAGAHRLRATCRFASTAHPQLRHHQRPQPVAVRPRPVRCSAGAAQPPPHRTGPAREPARARAGPP